VFSHSVERNKINDVQCLNSPLFLVIIQSSNSMGTIGVVAYS
jgi:hypothetical protein